MAQNTKGRWVPNYDLATAVSKSQKLEAYNRVDILHNILVKMFPVPVGVDVRVNRSAGNTYYGASRKYYFTKDSVLTFDYLNKLPIISFSYFANFSPHYCAHTNKGIVFTPGSKNENSDGIGILVNNLTGLANPPTGEDWTINGQPVAMMSSMITEKWKGYEMYGDVRLNGRSILIHRPGMLPYIPVTRKQYLERCINQTTRLYDKTIEWERNMPVRSLEEQEAEKKAKLAKFEKDFGKDPKRLKSAVDYYISGYKTDQQIRDERVTSAIRLKEQELKKFTDELEKTSREGLLDSPAVIRVMYDSNLIFDTDPKTGSMLITENPDYIRKDLSVHIPQLIIFKWKWSPDFYPAHKQIEKIFLQDFPIEKIQAMIDK
ncbi:MAG: hypothetical protein B6D37_03625 [Sphingobacteriales bacterium UTBCD1]|jgi:predicted transcriptional regulator|nr:MAG: hypothetical protein B6D37_03625 [Sphingobacteriales bacterium UTBCD1]